MRCSTGSRRVIPTRPAAFIERFQRRVFGVALRIVNDQRLAEDVAQETFLRAWQRASAFDPRRGTVDRVAAHDRPEPGDRHRAAAPDRDRRARRDPGPPDETNDRGPDDLAVARARTPSGSASRWATCPTEQCRALVLAAFYGRTAREIAESESIPLGTAKTRIRTAMLRLRVRAGRRHGGNGMSGPSAPNGCAPIVERLPELALGMLSGAERARGARPPGPLRVVPGRARRAGPPPWTSSPVLLGEAEPPAGFEGRTLERLRARAGARAPASGRWRRVLTRRGDRRRGDDRDARRGADRRRAVRTDRLDAVARPR